MPRIFDLDAEIQRAQQQRPRGLRPDVPVPFRGNVLGMGSNFGPTIAPFVGDSQVLGIPAANRAVNLVANGVASMSPLDQFAADGVTKREVPANICTRPNSSFPAFDFWHQAIAVAMMRGNFLGVLADFDPLGYARQVVPVPPELCYGFYDPNGFIVYNVAGTYYSPMDVVHVRAFAMPGSPWGIGMVEHFRRTWNQALEQQFMAADVYSRGAVPTGILTVDRPTVDLTQAEDTQDQWIGHHGGQRKPAVLPSGWKFQALSWSPEDAQFLQSRQFMVAEIALMAGVDPSDLGAALDSGQGSSITYANIEQKQIARQTDSYGPWMRRFEEAWSDLLPGGDTARFNPRRSDRMDAETAAKVNQINITSGVDTVDEVRKDLGKPPLPKPPPVQPDPMLPVAKEGADDPASSATNPDGTNPPALPPAPAASTTVAVPAHVRQMPGAKNGVN